MSASESSGSEPTEKAAGMATGPPSSTWQQLRIHVMRDPVAVASVIFLALIILLAAMAPTITPYTPEAANLRDAYAAPSPSNWLGTDQLGRDVLTRLVYAGRISLIAAFQAVGIGLAIGVVPGVVLGYLSGPLDLIGARIADLLLSFPSLVLAIGIVAAFGPSLTTAMIAVGIVFAPRFFRLVRGQALNARNEVYVLAAQCVGLPPWRILARHVLPAVWPPLIVQVSFALGLGLIIEASLSFLGLGVQPPQSSWGVMIGAARGHMTRAPWLFLAPGLVIFLTVLSFNTLGDRLRDVLVRSEDAE